MDRIAVLLTCFNRKQKTIACLKSLENSYKASFSDIHVDIFLTDDGYTDATSVAVENLNLIFPVHIQKGNGQLYWNGGMIKAWKAALSYGDFDGYLWLNDDTTVLKDFWLDISIADDIAIKEYGKRGIYVGSTKDMHTGIFTYGGFKYLNRWTLKDEFIHPNNKDFQPCQCAHGNITYISKDVVEKQGIFYAGYIHGAGDHDYTYRAYKKGFPILVMPHYCGECENDHLKHHVQLSHMTLKQRWEYMKSPIGYNLHNTLVYQRRNFPFRIPLVWLMGYLKLFFPEFSEKLYLLLRK